ncbi:MAG TPA: hypothetical protein VG367_17225 [Mucilaginibacter sp.]|jgi:hypothetical protein|nr:hypothetical protein [Mucilaginibacter sp.]
MEVHHHPQLHHEKKPWKEYLLEGLMIFLAVFMGFIAETIREGISDRSKGHEYIRSFVQDLKSDTASFSHLEAFDKGKVAGLSKLTSCYDTITNSRGADGCVVPLVKLASYNLNMNFTDGTLQQLKNAGGFRLLSKADRDSIDAYDHEVAAYKNFEGTWFQESQNVMRTEFIKLLNFKTLDALFPDSGRWHAVRPALYPNNKVLVNEFFNELKLYEGSNKIQGILLAKLKIHATTLIMHFEREYGGE